MPKNDIKTQDVVVMYTEKHLTLREIAKLTGMTHTGVWKRLKKVGITAHDGEHVKVKCFMCDKPFTLVRSRYKNTERHYCSNDCYLLSRSNPDYIPWNQGSRLARITVKQYFPLKEDHIVHNIDFNQRNNRLDNLLVYANESDYLKHHHGINKVKPLWDGRLV